MNAPNNKEQMSGWQRRSRRFWIWMGLLPGLLALPILFGANWIGDHMGSSLRAAAQLIALFWIGYCSAKLVKTREGVCPEGRFADGAVWFFALAVLNFIIGTALIFGCCALSYAVTH